jgi:mRNA interferase RelE/StbE
MYQIVIRRRAVKDLANLPSNYPNLVGQHINDLARKPRPQDAKKLKGNLGYALRVGVYRVLYDIDDINHQVTIYRIKHRRNAYQ